MNRGTYLSGTSSVDVVLRVRSYRNPIMLPTPSGNLDLSSRIPSMPASMMLWYSGYLPLSAPVASAERSTGCTCFLCTLTGLFVVSLRGHAVQLIPLCAEGDAYCVIYCTTTYVIPTLYCT